MAGVPALLDLVKIERALFGLPFGYLGMFLGAGGLPTAHQFLWISVAILAARNIGMSTNDLMDRNLDARNPHAAQRPLPSGRLSPGAAGLLSGLSALAMVYAAFQLNELCTQLFPIALVMLVGYSYVKYRTWLTHGVLGLIHGASPVGGWIGVTGSLSWEPLILGLGAGFWAAGFDLIYACRDAAFDRGHGIHTVPARYGLGVALGWSSVCHGLTVVFLALLGWGMALSWPYWVGLLLAAMLFVYEHRLVSPQDLSRVNTAFFTVNASISVLIFVFTLVSLYG